MAPTQDDPEILKRQQERQDKAVAENATGMSMVERFTRRAKANIVTIVFPDDDADAGALSIEMQIPSWGITCELTQMESLMQTRKGHKRIAAIMNDLCQSEGFDLDFWESGVMSLVDMRFLLERLTAESVKAAQKVQAAQSFRDD